ncbi:alpha-L-rhamnosidase N-terminal domain-containing protein [Streptomyces hokutonensis]|uniref:alpha-L-rhamnosidase N-terminal domain-containing protein n=1 Tax=Streptomyces hokutonensis TaxID=1306990 RepID=UPI0036788BB1
MWTGEEEPGEWAGSRFATRILEPADWVADWIGPEQKPVTREAPVDLSDTAALSPTPRTPVEDRLHPSPLVRQVFTLGRRPEHARLYITAHGVYEVTVNGQQITHHAFELVAPEHPVVRELRQARVAAMREVLRDG